jgi:NAD(P)-dependent dehydrogenase (short-subunit alcohol dehydrogenase family)
MGVNPFDLSGKVAVVTGGGTGLGKGMATGLAGAGALVVLAGRRQDVVERAAADIRATGGKAEGVSLDVTRIKEHQAFFDAIVSRHGGLDILVNNAGTNRRNPCLEYTEQDWDTVVDLNLKSVFFCSQAAARIMKERGGGKIINTACRVLSRPRISRPTRRGRVRMLTMQLASSWRHTGSTSTPSAGLVPDSLNDDLFRTRMGSGATPWFLGPQGTPRIWRARPCSWPRVHRTT